MKKCQMTQNSYLLENNIYIVRGEFNYGKPKCRTNNVRLIKGL